jgi:hypothetical protein
MISIIRTRYIIVRDGPGVLCVDRNGALFFRAVEKIGSATVKAFSNEGEAKMVSRFLSRSSGERYTVREVVDRVTTKEAIEIIKTAMAEVEWEYPMDYAVAFEMAIEALEKEENKMDKPLRNWTLGEVQNNCKEAEDCRRCVFGTCDGSCELRDSCPVSWDLTDPPRFTEQEVEDAKTLMRAFPGYTQVSRAGYDLYLKISDNAYHALILNYCMFPSIKDGETVELSDIIGGNND